MQWTRLVELPIADYVIGQALRLRQGASEQRAALGLDLERLATGREQLLGWSQQTEAGFLRIGQFVADSYQLLNTLREAGLNIRQTASEGPIGQNVHALERMAPGAFELLAEAALAQRRLIAGLESTSTQVGDLEKGQQELATILRALGPLATLLSIDSTTGAESARASSQTLAAELTQINERLRTWLDEQADQIAAARKESRDQSTALLAGLAARETAVVHQKTQCMTGVTRLGQEQARLALLSSQIAELVPAVEACLGQVMVALQGHDAVRQRIEHCCAGIAELDGQVTQDLDHPVSAPTALAFLSRLSTLEAHQLSSIRAVIEEMMQRLSDGLRTAVSGLANLVGSLESGVGAGAFAGLTATVQQISELVQGALDTESQLLAPALHRSTAAARALFAAYRTELKTIDSDLALSAVNAQIQSSRNGAESALNILGAHAGAISLEARQISTRRAAEFTRLEDDLALLARQMDAEGAARSTTGHQLLEQARQTREGLADAERDMNTQVQTIAEPAQQLQQGLLSVLAEVEEFGRAFTVAAPIQESLDRLSTAAEHLPLAPYFSQKSESRVEALRSRYSLAAERQLHDEAIWSDSPDREDEPAADSSVELF